MKHNNVGAKNGRAVLDVRKVKIIRKARRKVAGRELANRYGVSIQTIYSIWIGRTWGHV